MALDLSAVHAAAAAQVERVTPGIDDMRAYLASQVKERSHREVLGPLWPASGTSGVILHGGERIAAWGETVTAFSPARCPRCSTSTSSARSARPVRGPGTATATR
ncbi:hypothetical protein [Amycolatopsis sp. lyj-108]|uniref:hypothetical protein n=1 Tax=Amycolatopsis sp. lyj-108 TaxID=2789286 RepID=UPI00397B1861